MADSPNSFRDPFWTDLASGAEQRHGLPPGLLVSVLSNGEKSNADQVSEVGAKTPFQVTPETRALILKRDGIDAYLNPRNAADAAALVLKDGMNWAKGRSQDPTEQATLAAGYYHGGGDPKNWGARTQSYMQRVTAGLAPQQPDQSQPELQNGAHPGQSTFDRVLAQMQGAQATSQVQSVYQAYQSGQMTPEESSQYEQDVRAGKMMLPRGASLKDGAPGVGGAAPGTGAQPLPASVIQAYQGGQMMPSEMADLEHDVRGGAWQLPQGMTPDSLFGPAAKPMGMLDHLADAVTGNARKVPATEALPDWTEMPSLNAFGDKSAGLGAILKTALGTMFSNPQETAQVIQANLPGMKVGQDVRGNYIFTDPADGKQYAYKPGFRVSDIPRAAGGALAFTPAGRAETLIGAGMKAGATQAAIEGTQAATGGTFDSGEVLGSAALGAGVPVIGRALTAVAAPVKALVGRALGRVEPAVADARAAVTSGGADMAGAPAVAAPAIAAPPIQSTIGEVAQTALKAGRGSKSASEQLATAAAPDAETVAAAQRLGIQDHLQPDHVTTNDGFRQVLGVVKSNPTGELAQQERAGLAKVAERANGLVDEIGGTSDLSAMDQGIKSRMQAAHAELSAREDALYQKLRDTIPATTEAPAKSALEFVDQRAKDLGGTQNLSPMEKNILSRLSSKSVEKVETIPANPDKVGLGIPGSTAQKVTTQAVKQPTFSLLDDVRRDVGAAARMKGPFSDADTGLAKKYYGLLSQDQNAVAHGAGMGDVADAARAATITRKGMENDLASLFGKSLDLAAPGLGANAGSIVPQLSGAMKSASAGDTSKLLAVLKSTPDSMKQEVVASGLATVFRNAATRGDMNFTGYAKWYENLQRNKQAYTAVMAHLPPAARTQLTDLARVSKGISDSLSARTKNGLRSSVLEEMKAPDTLAARLFELAKHAGKGLAADAVGGHGAGLALAAASAIKGNAKPSAIKAIDELLTSTEFQHLASTVGTSKQTQNVRAFAYSKPFTAFVRAVGNPRELSNRERWILQALEERNNRTR